MYCYILCHFSIPNYVKAGAEAGAALRYGSGSDQKIRLLAAPALQHCVPMLDRINNLSRWTYVCPPDSGTL
jgi:hypothetical protein